MNLYYRSIIGLYLSANLSTTSVIQAIKRANMNRVREQPAIIHNGMVYTTSQNLRFMPLPMENFIRTCSNRGTRGMSTLKPCITPKGSTTIVW